MLLHKSTFQLYLECYVQMLLQHRNMLQMWKTWEKSRRKLCTDFDVNRDQKVWNCLLLSLGKEWGIK